MESEKKVLSKKEKRKEVFRAIKFTLFSISAGLIEFGSFTLFSLLPGYYKGIYWIPATASLLLSIIWNFTLNRRFTFQSAKNIPVAMLQVLAFYLVFGPISIWLAQMYLIDTLGWNELLVKGIVMAVNFITEFLYQRLVVFRTTIDTNDIAQKEKEKEEREQQA